MKIENFKEKLVSLCEKEYHAQPRELTANQLHCAVSKLVMDELSPVWDKSRTAHDKARKASYLSMEFLVGRAIYNNLLCLGILDSTAEELKALGVDISEFEEVEDAALGNGGLGRLAACFLDSAATLDLPLDGYGIRYKYGLFKQGIKDGFQTETADDWQRYGDPWSVRREQETVVIHFADGDVNAVPYDYPVIGYGTENVGTLRLWQAETDDEFDFDLFNRSKFTEAGEKKRAAEDISRVLYPNDETEAGKILRLKQEYFFSAAAVADLIRKHKAIFGTMENFADYNCIQMNDTHPVIALPEFIRVVMRDEGWKFDKAFEAAKKVFNYTNHTIMQEALEKWDSRLIEQIVPEVYSVMIMLNEAFESEMHRRNVPQDKRAVMRLIKNGTVHMANIAVFGSSYVNGVAAIHTELLKTTVLKDWYELYPERFQNKTNGITQRRWLALCNRELSALITELLGDDSWVTDLDKLSGLKKYADDESVLRRFIDIKHAKKQQLADFIKKSEGIEIDPKSVFDIQIKRLHEYKRQLLNAFSILYLYYEIKDGNLRDFTPTTFIFGAKSAPGYYRAKGIIKFINEVAKLVNSDPDTKDLLRVVFVSNYRVSYAEKLVAAADISEQISTAGTEASGTGNMKFMLNGAVTLGTLDGANVEIAEEAGAENEYIFGATVEELEKIIESALENFFGTPLFYFSPSDRTYSVLLHCSEEEGKDLILKINNCILRLHDYLLDTYDIWLFAGIGRNTDSLMNVWECYQQASEVVSYTTKNYIFFPYEFIKKDSNVFYYPPEISTKLIHFISTGNTSQVLELFNLIHQENIEERTLPVNLLKYLLSDIRNTLLKARFALPQDADPEAVKVLDERFNEHLTFKLCEDLALSLCNLFGNKEDDNTLSSTIEKYIKDNYKDPSLGLNKISDEFQISESYFSHMFKEKTGVNFSTYLENIRMAEAARLIQETDISLNELYIAVGYNNSNTFRRAFKKVYGVTPSAMREK